MEDAGFEFRGDRGERGMLERQCLVERGQESWDIGYIRDKSTIMIRCS